MSDILKEAFNEAKKYNEAVKKNAKSILSLEDKKLVESLVKESLDEMGDDEQDMENDAQPMDKSDSLDSEIEDLYQQLKNESSDEQGLEGLEDEDLDDSEIDDMIAEMEGMLDEDDDEIEIDLDSIDDSTLEENDDEFMEDGDEKFGEESEDDYDLDFDDMSDEADLDSEEADLVEDIMSGLKEMGYADDEEMVESMDVAMGVGKKTTHSPKFSQAGKSRHPQSNVKNESKQIATLKSENEKLKSGIKKLQENFKVMRLFSDNLVNITKLFTEHTLTQKEKRSIVEKFDSVKSLDESKKLFESINKKLLTSKNEGQKINENINKQIFGNSKSKITETKSYTNDESFNRMVELMKYDSRKRNK